MNITRSLQTLFGLLLILFGLNSFFGFLPIPEKQGFAFEFLKTLHEAKYLFPLIATIMTTSGILLVMNKWTAFALLLQLPVSVNIFAFHLFHDWQGLIPAWVLFALNTFLIFRRLGQFKPLFNKQG
ncbi:MAG: DoxX protein [Verrucomicrobia bacterium]|nr:DoxX protein [Verrucomicrobiota bacterium]